MSDESNNAPRVPLFTEGDVVLHKASKQTAVVLSARIATIHDKTCPHAKPFACLNILPPCDCATVFSGKYAISIEFDEYIFVDECVLDEVS